MTHDKLLIEINRRLDVALYNGDAQSIHALRAIVELVKPNEYDSTDAVYWKQAIIQAVEKELK